MTLTPTQEARKKRLMNNRQETIENVTAYAAFILSVDMVVLFSCMGIILWIARGGYNPAYFELWQIVNIGAIVCTTILPSLAIGCFVGGVLYPNISED